MNDGGLSGWHQAQQLKRGRRQALKAKGRLLDQQLAVRGPSGAGERLQLSTQQSSNDPGAPANDLSSAEGTAGSGEGGAGPPAGPRGAVKDAWAPGEDFSRSWEGRQQSIHRKLSKNWCDAVLLPPRLPAPASFFSARCGIHQVFTLLTGKTRSAAKLSSR